ncbi:ABC transporter permease [Calditrichota bacterium]
MLKNYFIVTLRNIVRNKLYSIINISGLSIGMASFILIALWVQDELNYDMFHNKVDHIHRVLNREKYSTGEELYFAQCPPGLAPVLKSNYPEMTQVARVRNRRDIIIKFANKRFNEDNILFVDPSFFSIFSFPIKEGSPEINSGNPYSVAITEEMAQKYFGDLNPIGKILNFDNKLDLKVSQILKNVPSNSHLQFNFVVPFERLKDFGMPIEGWDSFAYGTYILLNYQANHLKVSDKITNVIKDHQESAIVTSSLQPIKDIHLYSSNIGGLGGDGDIKYIYIFSAIAILVLLTACINFMNLSTARSGKRAKEVGLRKVIGANRKEIIFQFFNESLIIAFIAMFFAYTIVSMALSEFNLLAGKQLEFTIFSNIKIFLIVIVTVFFTGIVSGSYPAVFLSSFQPAKTLKGILISGTRGNLFRRILVSSQFVLTICLIFGTLVINRQLQYIKNKKLGYEKDHVISISLQGDLSKKAEFLRNELLTNSNVINVSATTDAPSNVRRSFIVSEWYGNTGEEKYLANFIGTDENYLNTLQLQMTQGRYFSKDFMSDSMAVIVNEAALAVMGMDEPIGKKFMENYHIIGVIKDFHFQSLHKKIAPLVIFYQPEDYQSLLTKIKSDQITETINEINIKWQRLVPEFPLEFHFLDEHIDKQYHADQQAEKIINIFTILALFIAILGLLGMASYIAELRTKEIGIRKTLGASIPGIFSLLSKEFVKWILIANILAFPIGWYVMNKWLQSFAYRMDLTIWLFLFSGILAIGVAILTVSFQVFKAAIMNPVKALRYEQCFLPIIFALNKSILENL